MSCRDVDVFTCVLSPQLFSFPARSKSVKVEFLVEEVLTAVYYGVSVGTKNLVTIAGPFSSVGEI